MEGSASTLAPSNNPHTATELVTTFMMALRDLSGGHINRSARTFRKRKVKAAPAQLCARIGSGERCRTVENAAVKGRRSGARAAVRRPAAAECHVGSHVRIRLP